MPNTHVQNEVWELSYILASMGVLAVLNSHFYHQYLNKINKNKCQNLELGFTTHIFHEFWYVYILQGNTWKYTKMHNQEGAFKQNNKQAHPNSTLGPEH